MVAKSKLDPQHERYRSRGALITLPQMLIQRQAAKALAYVSHARSIAGISGLHLSKIRGRGIDFEEFRPYQAGDDIRLIDWRATARTGRAVTKVFREERERPVIIAVDQCSSMFCQFRAWGIRLLARPLSGQPPLVRIEYVFRVSAWERWAAAPHTELVPVVGHTDTI